MALTLGGVAGYWYSMRKGYSVNPLQTLALQDAGMNAKNIYQRGRNGETLAAALQCLRDGGELWIAADLRIFGSKRKEILAVTDMIEAAKVRIVDVRDPKASLSRLIDIAISKTAGDARKNGKGKTLKAAGRKGGKVKAECQELRRAEVAHKDVVQRLCACDKISWREKAAILGPLFSPATLRRHYM